MKLENRFTVPAGADTAWDVLLDVERITPCVPGATLTEVDGDQLTGEVAVELGPVNLTYGWTARIVSRDDEARVAVVEGSGTRGTGTAKATVTCRLHERGAETTDVEVDIDLPITGTAARFGRGVLADVSARLVDQVAACLAEEIREDAAPSTATGTAGAAGAGATAASTGEQTDGPDATPVQGETPPSGDGVGAGADGGAAAAAKVAAEARERAQETTAAPAAGAAVAASGAEGLEAGSAGPGVPVHSRGATPEGARQDTDTSPRPPRSRPRRSAEAIDLLDTAGAPVAKRAVPVLVGMAALVVVVRRLLR